MRKPSYKSVFGQLAKRIGHAIDKSHSGFMEGRVEHEPAFTDRMLGRIEQSIDGIEIGGVQWAAKTLTDRGRDSQESKDGADFMGVLNVDLPDYQISKGFLAQAKMIRDDGFNDFRELVDQCRKMLKLTPAAFVFLYSQKGVTVTSAAGVVAAGGVLRHLEMRKASMFFDAHLQCFLGDSRISAATPLQLEELRLREGADRAFLISTTTAW